MTGKEIFDKLVQYPLEDRKSDKIYDYIVYVFKKQGDYSRNARLFFDRFYPNYVVLAAKSLEGTMKALAAHAAANGVTQIRELVLVAHGATTELYPQVIEDLTDSTDTSFACITQHSLSALQKVFQAGGVFQDFHDARNAVCALLKDDSWVTIRACNIGQSRQVMYALFVFFGGKANVYAPTVYVMFARMAIATGKRLGSDLDVYDHLRRQHFLAVTEHTSDRKSEIVASLVDPASFAAPVRVAELASSADDTAFAAYNALKTALGHRRIPAAISTALAAAGHTLTQAARVYADPPGSGWKILDATVDEQHEPLQVQYLILDRDDGTTKWLEARAQIADARSALKSFPIQLLLDQPTHDAFVGRFILTGYIGDASVSDPNRTKLEAIQTLLDAETFGDATGDIKLEIKTHDAKIDFTNATIHKVTAGKKWSISAKPPLYVARLDVELATGTTAHGIFAYYDRTDDEVKAHALDLIEHGAGTDPDIPGTELPAYLDRFSKDELLAFMDYLRTPYRPMNAFFLSHALQAISRKYDPTAVDPNAAPLEGLLDGNQYTDLVASTFPCEFNRMWSEVRASSNHPTTFTTDPFEDPNQLLSNTLLMPDAVVCDDSDPDSPSVDVQDLRASESNGRAKYFTNHGGKDGWPTPVPEDDDCADFGLALDKIKELQIEGKTPPEIKAALEGMASSKPGESLLDKIVAVKDFWSFAQGMTGQLFQSAIYDNLLKAADVAELLVTDSDVLDWTETFLGDFAGEAMSLTMTAISVPQYLWKHVMDELSAAYAHDKDFGELAAFRWWFYQISEIDDSSPIPTSLALNVTNDDDVKTAYWEVYRRDHFGGHAAGFVPTTSTMFVLSPEDLKDGYFKGALIIDRIRPQIFKKADQYVSDVIDSVPLDPCKLKHLRDAGFIDFDGLRRVVLRKIAWTILTQLPLLPPRV